MHYMSDEEFFGMIPQADGGHVRGNATNHWHTSLKNAYLAAFLKENAFPDQLEFKGSGSTRHKSKKNLKRNRKDGLREVYQKAFPKIDRALEKHLDETNGYISEFPPAEVQIYDSSDWEAFNYFKHGPDKYIPDPETNLRRAYGYIHDPCLRTFGWRLFWCLIAAAVASVVLWGGQIYTRIPVLNAWIAQSGKNSNIFTAILVLFLQTVGWFVPAKRLELGFEDHVPAHMIMLGGITGWGLLYFAFTMGPAPESGVDEIIYHIVKWPYLIYFVAAFLFHLVYLFKVIPDVVYHYKYLKSYKNEYVQIYEEEIHKLCRYLRLRELWMERENASMPYWLIRFQNRLKKYRKEYESIVK